MRKPFKSSPLLADQGQALVEYLLMVLLAISIVGLVSSSLRRGIITVWQFYITKVSAACPDCPADPTYRF